MCPICGNTNKNSIRSSLLPDFFLCNVCGGYFAKNLKEVPYFEEYFQEKNKPSFFALAADYLFRFFNNLKIRKILSLVDGKNDPIILDYGCGAGKLVEILLAKKIRMVGYEPSKGGRTITQKKKLPVYDHLQPAKDGYNLIMFWHSLEHAPNPFAVLEELKKYLAKDGKVLIAVPNAAGWEAKIARRLWFHYSYPLHLIQFTPSSVKIMLNNAGFRIMNIDFLNLEYTLSGLVQTFLNLFLPKDVLYSVLAHRRLSMHLSTALFYTTISLFILIIFSPLLILFLLLELILKKTGAMIIIAQYENQPALSNVWQ